MKKLHFIVENYLFYPSLFGKIVAFLLLPVSLLYCFLTYLKRLTSSEESFNIPIISIGNLIIGGSGKTPLTIALAKKYSNATIILRGYKRESQGLVVVSENGKIKSDVKTSGDEAMELSYALPNATIIVSQDRKEAILKAKSLGAKIIFLDDGFSKFSIKKFNILLKPNEKYLPFCIPSGPYRFHPLLYKSADIVLTDGIDFKREVSIKNKTSNMIFLTAISKPNRLDRYLSHDIQRFYLPDHSKFQKEFIDELIKKYSPTSILTTNKDAVKLDNFNLNLSILELNINIDDKIVNKIDNYIQGFKP